MSDSEATSPREYSSNAANAALEEQQRRSGSLILYRLDGNEV